ncbi:hypothetical protein LOK49_LG03G02551, partial [Camellia lanceoleosa]
RLEGHTLLLVQAALDKGKNSDRNETSDEDASQGLESVEPVVSQGWRVYLQDEHGTSIEAMNLMIDRGISKSARQGRIDAYTAMMMLERYFSLSGHEIELVLPKQLELQEKLRIGPPTDHTSTTNSGPSRAQSGVTAILTVHRHSTISTIPCCSAIDEVLTPSLPHYRQPSSSLQYQLLSVYGPHDFTNDN